MPRPQPKLRPKQPTKIKDSLSSPETSPNRANSPTAPKQRSTTAARPSRPPSKKPSLTEVAANIENDSDSDSSDTENIPVTHSRPAQRPGRPTAANASRGRSTTTATRKAAPPPNKKPSSLAQVAADLSDDDDDDDYEEDKPPSRPATRTTNTRPTTASRSRTSTTTTNSTRNSRSTISSSRDSSRNSRPSRSNRDRDNRGSTATQRGDPDTLLRRAATRGSISEARRLLREGADPDLPDRHGWTSMHWAATDSKSDGDFIR